MRCIGVFDCPEVKKNDNVEVIYNCYNINDVGYKNRVKCKVVYVNKTNCDILVELPSDYIQIGEIKGWLGDENSELLRCLNLDSKKLYWWVNTWRILKKQLDIE